MRNKNKNPPTSKSKAIFEVLPKPKHKTNPTNKNPKRCRYLLADCSYDLPPVAGDSQQSTSLSHKAKPLTDSHRSSAMTSYYNPSKRMSEWAAALLSPYIKLESEDEEEASNAPSPSLSVGLWSGNVELQNVAIRPDAIEKFLNTGRDDDVGDSNNGGDCSTSSQIKWKLRRGHIDSVKIQIPWKSLLVGSAFSSNKSTGNPEDGSSKATRRVDDESASGTLSTTIQIEGVSLQLGYEIVHHDPLLIAPENQQNNELESSSFQSVEQLTHNDHLRTKIRQEKNRILQIAERRLLAGLDPFPPSLMEELHSIIHSTIHSDAAASLLQPTHYVTSNDDNASAASIRSPYTLDTTTSTATSTYLSRMENYLSSTIKSLLWRIVDSLSVSVTQVKLSIVGCSHYDKDHASLLKKESAANKKSGGDSSERNENQQQMQHDQSQQEQYTKPLKKNNSIRDLSRRRRWNDEKNPSHRNFNQAPFRRSLSAVGQGEDQHRNFNQSSLRRSLSAVEQKEEQREQSNVGINGEDPLIWSREGQIEVGISLDRLDIKPGSDVQSDSAVLKKKLRLRGLGVYIRRTHLEDIIAPCDDAVGVIGEHTGRKLVWKVTNNEDFVLMPMTVNASCKVYRKVSGSVGVGLVSPVPSSPQIDNELSTIGSKATMTTKRRGKRDKRQTLDPIIRGPMHAVSSTAPSTESLDTIGNARLDRGNSPHRLDVSMEIGHVRCSFSPRQIFLFHSFLSSMTRMRRGRPQKTIHSARAHDRALIESMAEEGKMMLWKERMYREVLSLRPRSTTRTIPRVVTSWWKYAFFNVVNEIRQRRRLLSRCRGESNSTLRDKESSFVTRQNLDFQSRIRREYIDLYLAAYRPTGDASSTDEAKAALEARFRLAKMEDVLPIQRLLLLKSIARAASGQHTQIEDHSSPADIDFIFSPTNSQSLDSMHWSEQKKEETNAAGNGLVSTKKCESVHSLHDISVTGTPLTFTATLAVSGISLEICDFRDRATHQIDAWDNVDDISDDISTLTGFSEGVPRTIKRTRIGDTFDPFIQLGSAQRHGFNCEQIMVMHIAGISLSSRRLIIDSFQSSTDFSIDGISLQMACVESQQNLLHIGRIPESDGESAINLGTSKSESDGESSISIDTSNYSKGVSGRLSSSRNTIIVGPADIIVDWGWIERMVKFASTNTDTMPVRATPALDYEDILVKSFLNPSTKLVGGHAAISLKCDAMSLTVPLQNAVATGRIDQKYIIATANRLHVDTVTAVVPASESYGETIIHTLPNQDMLFVLDGLDTIILTRTQKEDLVEMPRMSTPFFRSPINVQLQYLSGSGSFSFDQPRYSCSYDVRSPTIHLLVSEARLRSLMTMVETVTMSLGISTVVDSDLYETPGLMIPALADFALAETKLSIQSFGIHVVTDESAEEHSDDLTARAQLEDAIASFLTQLSYLDFEHPSQVASACLSKLFIDRVSALGISEEEAQQCIETAKALFTEEARAKCFSSSMHVDVKNEPLHLSEALDHAVLNSTRMTLAKFGNGLPIIWKEEFELVAESLLVSKSFLYYGSSLQTTVKSLTIRNQRVTLLKIFHQSSGIQPIQTIVTPDESALTITVQDHSIVNRDQDIYFEICRVELTFSPEDVLDVAATCGKILKTVSGRKDDHHPETPVNNFVVNGSLSSLTIVLTDKLLPFIECRLQDIICVRTDEKNHTTTQTIVHAGAVSLECVIESSYPNIISTYTKEIAGSFNEQSAFSIQLTTRESCPNEISIQFNGVRIVFLQQIINELLQYISCPSYGIGLFLNRFVTERGGDGPSKFNVLIYNSSIILPRDSKSIDMIGIEIKEVSITQEQAAETWVIDKPSFSNVAPSKVPDKRVKIAASLLSSDIFFDCIDDKQSSTNISRVAIDVKGAQVFTALNPRQVSTREIDMAAFNSNVLSTGRIVHNKLPFAVVGEVDQALREDLTLRVWEEINEESPLSLKITLDSVPYLRLLIEDVDDDNLRGAHFSLRMSQFYLALSIWFSNMQELPILFPYDIDFLDKLSKDPTFPSNWPQYGTSEFVTRLKKCDSDADRTFEMALCFKNLTWRCLYDDPNYFAAVPPSMSSMRLLPNESERGNENFISIVLMDVICRIDLDEDNLQRIGVAASSVELLDGRQRKDVASYKKGLVVEGDNSQPSIIDLNWGLDCGRHTLIEGLPMPFQVTVFLTPDMNCLINLGMNSVEAVLADLTPIWIILDYFGLYFTAAEYGHPARQADVMYGNALGKSSELDDNGINLDFRMWMIRPHVVIPSSADICIMLEAEGLYYRYKSFGRLCASQEIVARELGIVALAEYMSPSTSRDLRQVSGSLGSSGAKTLIEDMSFSLRYVFNASDTTTNGTPKAPFVKVALRMPLTPQHFDPRSMDGIECSSIDAQPFIVPPPVVCKPFIVPSRDMGHHETTIYLSHEYMKLMVDLMTSFVGQGQDIDSMTDDNMLQDDDLSPENLFSVVAHIEQVKFVLSDPIMGMHHPILSVCFPSLLLTASQLEQIQQDSMTEISSDDAGKFNNASDLQVSVEATAFIDYFKLGLMTRNWEEFVEPFKCLILYERSASRGMGVTFDADCPMHLNVSSASIETLDDAIKSFSLLLSGSMVQHPKKHPLSDIESFSTVSAADEWGRKVTVLHRAAEQLGENERIAFSLENRTGELLRVHTHSPLETDATNSQATVIYLNHLNIMPLDFPATETAIKNLQSVEVPFKGDKNNKTYHELTSHEIDFQIPAFRWVRAVSFDKTGKSFLQIIPRSPIVESKIVDDWRLRNALHVLTDIKSVTGGRRLSISSPFQVINKTGHSLLLATHPDPRHCPDSHQDSNAQKGFPVSKINPDQSHCISFLLIERALRLSGNHLGSLWIRPDQSSTDEFNTADLDPNSSILDSSSIGFPHRPIQLAKILHESSIIFKDNNGDPEAANQVASGIEISCSVIDKINENPQPTSFCYVVEVKRSPFARLSHVNIPPPEISSPPTRIGKGLKTPKKLFRKNTPDEKPDIHAPIAYSLVIHPPLIIENLLPERGRFELMHAISGILMWSGVLGAGERLPIFTVGLDAPLFLHVNLGYCRSTVGEGALVHHGGGDGLFKPWNVFHGAMKTSRDRVKRTLNTIAETKDSRGINRLAGISTNQIQKDKVSGRRIIQLLGTNTENDINPNLLKRGNVYGMEDIATELSAVDSLGQRITLQIENVLGSGGQRQITLYSPFWIVNTTEHSLRYKQDKSPFFVAGTVLSKSMDGSKPVDEGHRSFLEIVEGDSSSNSVSTLDSLDATIFSGKPGAMALLKRNMNCPTDPALIAALISNDLPLHIVSNIAFMFNFQDVLTLRGLPRLCIQLIDTQHDISRYTSAWSSAFGLESVGVTQIVGMHCKDGRGLEVGVSISVGPGRLGEFTKIVRICPRYVVVNQLPFPIRIWQDSSLHHPNVTVEDSSTPQKSQKWMFAKSETSTNEYEQLFGLPALIDVDDKSGMVAQTSAHQDACFIATVRPLELVTFHLPDTKLERSLRVDFGPLWCLSPSIPADIPAEYVLVINRVRDLRLLPHVSSRGAPVYTVTLPPTDNHDWNGELGVFFETEWGRERKLIVKGIKEGSYASYFTDIAVGDEMIMIDSTPVRTLTFDDAMKYMKVRLITAKEAATNSSPTMPLQLMMNKKKKRIHKTNVEDGVTIDNTVTLTFLTLEERLRRLRRAAVGQTKERSDTLISNDVFHNNRVESYEQESESPKEVLVDMKFLFQSIFVFLRTSSTADPPYRITNRSLHWRIYYRQRACDSHPWKCLSPGESSNYTWEEPMKTKKLSVRVGAGEWIDSKIDGRKIDIPVFSFQFVQSEEQGHFGAVKTVKLEEIGYIDRLPCPFRGPERSDMVGGLSSSLICEVDTEGSTRVLYISDDEMVGNQQGLHLSNEALMRCHLESIKKTISDEKKRRAKIDKIIRTVTSIAQSDGSSGPPKLTEEDSATVEVELQDFMDYDEGHYITKRNQVMIEVMEATGLRSSDLNGFSNPFVQVKLICRNKTRRIGSFGTRNPTRCTYFVEKTLSPQWCDQSFIFDVPEKAAYDPKETRRYSIQCVIKSVPTGITAFPGNKFLGQAHVHLRNVKDQKENVGWYPLMGKLGESGIGKDPLDRVCGSIRLRVQWVNDIPGLLEYYLLCANRRLSTLNSAREGMKRQLKASHDLAKEEKELEESVSIARVPALAAIRKKTDDERRSSHHSKLIMGVRQLIGKGKRATNVKTKNRILVSSLLDSMLEESSDSSRDYEDSSVSNESPIDFLSSSPRSEYPCHVGVAGTMTPSSPLNAISSAETFSHSQIENARHVSLRWRNYTAKSTSSISFVYPLYPSLNISRLFANPTMKSKRSNPQGRKESAVSLFELRKLLPSAPHLFVEREKKYLLDLIESRTSFSKAARRSLDSIFNPGGTLTIRPMTALNLPDSYAGMFVKVRYDNRVQSTVSVDSKVTPVWSKEQDIHQQKSSNPMKRGASTQIRKRGVTSDDLIHDFRDIAEIFNPRRTGKSREYEINIQISPFETSKSLRLSVIGELRHAPNVEIGVLDIPLGPALECTTDEAVYIRWFPLKSPTEAIPIEGDMNASCRPVDSEKLSDGMFSEYNPPCVKLALMFRPNSVETDDSIASGTESSNKSKANQYLYLRINQISASLIDSNRTIELASLSARDADVRYSVTTAKTRLAVAVGNIQLDHQSYDLNSQAPVILAPTPVKCPEPTVQFLAWKDNIRSKSDLDSYEYVACQVQEMDLKIEESWLCDVWRLYCDIAKTREAKAALQHVNRSNVSNAFELEQIIDPIANATLFLKEDEKVNRKRIYVRELTLGFFKLNLSYFKSLRSTKGNLDLAGNILSNIDGSELLRLHVPLELPDRQSTGSDDAYVQWSQNHFVGVDERTPYTNIFSAVLPRISDAPISFNERVIYHVYETEGDIWKSLRSFYSAESLRQIYKIVGSLDFVGNPTMVLTSFRTGLRDFILQPSRALKTKNPSRVGVGLLKGTLSLVSNSASGIFGFASNLGATFGETATQLTLDEHFQRLHYEQKAAQQRHYDRWKQKGFGQVSLMVSRPVSDIVFSVISASTGLVVEPYRGAKEDGLAGFAKGSVIGVIGVVVKPIVGLSDAFSHVTESIHDIAKSVNLLELRSNAIVRYRLPSVFGPQKMLLPFNPVASRSAQLLKAHPLEKKTKMSQEAIIASEALNRGSGFEHYIVVTTFRVILFGLKVVDGQGFVTTSLIWQVRFDKLAKITSNLGNKGHSGYILYISRYSSLTHGKSTNWDELSQHKSKLGDSTLTLNQTSQLETDNFDGKNVTFGFLRPFASTEDVDCHRYTVEGEVKHRVQLSRIHNAICCICGDFNSVVRENYHTNGEEGITSFGPYIFEKITPLDDKADRSFLYAALERTVWKCEPSLFSITNLENTPSWVCEEAESQTLSLENVSRKYNAVVDEDFVLHSRLDCDSIDMSIESGEIEDASTSDQDSFVESFGTFPFLTRQSSPVCEVDEFLPPSNVHVHSYPPSVDADSTSSLSERVRRVEALLENLVRRDSSAAGETAQTPASNQVSTDYDPYRLDSTSLSPLSCTPSGNVDVRALMREIEDLKQQLSLKNDS